MRHLLYQYNNAKSKRDKALVEDNISYYHSDKDIRKETNTEKLEGLTERLSECFLPLASASASFDLKNSINSNTSQAAQKTANTKKFESYKK